MTLINRDEVVDIFEKRYCSNCERTPRPVICRACWVGDALDIIEDAAGYFGGDIKPVVHGHWVSPAGKFVSLDDEGDTRHEACCSVCGDWLTASDEYATRGKYCPNCGAIMDVKEEG